MYDSMYRANRHLVLTCASLLLAALAISSIAEVLGLDTNSGLRAAIFVMSLCVLADPLLSKLMLREAFQAVEGIDLEEAMDRVYEEEKARRRRLGKSV